MLGRGDPRACAAPAAAKATSRATWCVRDGSGIVRATRSAPAERVLAPEIARAGLHSFCPTLQPCVPFWTVANLIFSNRLTLAGGGWWGRARWAAKFPNHTTAVHKTAGTVWAQRKKTVPRPVQGQQRMGRDGEAREYRRALLTPKRACLEPSTLCKKLELASRLRRFAPLQSGAEACSEPTVGTACVPIGLPWRNLVSQWALLFHLIRGHRQMNQPMQGPSKIVKR